MKRMWLVMMAVVVMSGSVFAADEANHDAKPSTETTEKAETAKTSEVPKAPEIRKDAKERLVEFINACMPKRADASKPALPVAVK